MFVTQQLSKRYDKVNLSFPDVSLADGEQCVLVGDSGKGKTTWMHIVGGLLKGDNGSVLLNNNQLTKLSGAKMDVFRGQNIGFIFQKNYLIATLNVRDNIAIAQHLSGQKVNDKKVKELMTELGINDYARSKISQLSHGQAQRVAIARAMVCHPQLILADEPTASLDDKHAFAVIDMLQNQAKKYNAIMIIATHDQRVKDMFDRQILLD